MAQCNPPVGSATATATDFASASASSSIPGIVALDGVIDAASLYRQALQLRWEPQLPARVRPNAAAAVHFLLQSRLRELESPHPPGAVQGDGRVKVVLPLADQIVCLRHAAAALQRNINSLDGWNALSELDIPGNHVSDQVMREAFGQSAGPADGSGAPPMQEAADAGADAEAEADPGASDSSVEEQRNSAAIISTINSIRTAFGHPPI